MLRLCEDEKKQNTKLHQFELKLKNTKVKKILENIKQKHDEEIIKLKN